ncbi:hypothetical protein A3742_12855 [Oleiphilus sp. HI0071]|uniref:class I SAM-dependent methyltransferase n=1 Tax=unclassified Oleiphilus TaxID=2631174 RepID=UPI0007C3C906|nr:MULTISPECIES: class I SAM-dependent methyltransferase [unclassified Oleiphilus]KZY73642.1 hypothetical protein A3737_16215 [Oleiphilus sp. HI0065]KZY80356.1 hypothetical protein A3742_12855 [Oleiphilus sp. HI0071]KZZ12643.1 hypothetical protein A3750_05165 [Oleiphilus sp. HI0079]KZZ18354.1 hypothetical protein A3751_08555 [Oleiphilus sp. HI0080]
MNLLTKRYPKINRTDINGRKQRNAQLEEARLYRLSDETEIKATANQEVASHLEHLCSQFAHNINALDVGCGTGRFFHALKGVDELTGIDPSKEMLLAAKHPLHGAKLDVQNIKLTEGVVDSAKLLRNGYDLIYAIAVFGYPAPIDRATLDKLYSHLAPGGKLFFTIANRDDASYKSLFEKSRTRKMLEAIRPYLPAYIGARLASRWQHAFLSQKEMESMFEDSLFTHFRTWPMANRFIACEAEKH